MGFPITFLQALENRPLTKRYWMEGSELKKSSYPHVSDFSSETFEVSNIEEFYNHVKEKAPEYKCLLKGTLLKDLNGESRSGSTDSNVPTRWICLDIDGLKGAQSEDVLIAQIPCLQGVSYVSQTSSSMGVEPGKGLSKHLFFILSAQINPQLLKNWLVHLNLTLDILKDSLTLSRSNVTLKWPLDISTCQNDKLLYIAPPILEDGVVDHYEGERITLVKKERDEVVLDISEVSLDRNDSLKLKTINALRKEITLPPKKKEVYKNFDNVQVLMNPGKAQVTGEKKERGFTYLNINGGDSWGYYFPDENPRVLYNFKGEPNYLLEEFIPDYYRSLNITKVSPDIITKEKSGTYWLAFRDYMTDKYFIGYYDYDKKELNISKTDSLAKLKDFLKEHGQYVPNFIPTWHYDMDFKSDVEFDPDNKFINQYVRSDYMKSANMASRAIPPLTDKLLDHTFRDLKDHFLNWLSVIVQYRTKTNTAWILTGTQGSGKGVIANKLIIPLVGYNYSHVLNNLTSFEKEFNKHLATSLFTFVDESCISDSPKYIRVSNKIKNFITEERMSIRAMRTDEYMVLNNNNFMFASNQFDPMQIDADDRRFTVVNRQMRKLLEIMTKKEIEFGLESELYDFCGFLLNYEADLSRAATIIDTEDRKVLQDMAVDSGISAANAILSGNLQFFINNIPDNDDPTRIGAVLNIESPPSYVDIINEFMESEGTSCKIPRKYLQILLFYTAGWKHDNPGQFTKHLTHKGLSVKQIWHKRDGNVQGIQTNWNITDSMKKQWDSIYNNHGKGVHLAVSN